MQLQTEIEHLFSTQQKEWDQLRSAVRQLDDVKTKTFSWDDQLHVNVQFNPARSALMEASPQRENKPGVCCLCEPNRPAQQRGIPFLDKYIILCNPFPILRNHLTIPLFSHVPQRMGKKIRDMLTLAEQLPDYVVFYNGPDSGASIADHFHLQAGRKMPVLLQGDHELRSCLTIESENKNEVEELFDDVLHYLKGRQPEKEEPMMNVITYMDKNSYRVQVFPRSAHRPSCYYMEGKEKILVSPGAIDMAGCIITVREEDFDKIEKQHIIEIFTQVSLPVI